MIGRLKGILIEKTPPHVLIDIHGIAYEVQTSMQTFYRLPELNESVVLYTHFIVREDAQQLYGFWDERERTLFRTLIRVNGVGPKLALTILSSIDSNEFVQCVMDQDSLRLTTLPGVGKKTAERLIIEMRDRLTDWHVELPPIASQVTPTLTPRKRLQDAISALVTLGYKPQEASKALSQLDPAIETVEEMIRLALRRITA
jgi:Holliday junction DNA helicase RuvA